MATSVLKVPLLALITLVLLAIVASALVNRHRIMAVKSAIMADIVLSLVSQAPLSPSVTLDTSVLEVSRYPVLCPPQTVLQHLIVACVQLAISALKALHLALHVQRALIDLIQERSQPMTACQCLLGSTTAGLVLSLCLSLLQGPMETVMKVISAQVALAQLLLRSQPWAIPAQLDIFVQLAPLISRCVRLGSTKT